jgi:archaellin
MKLLMVVFISCCVFLGACNQPAQAPTTPTEETPLLTDADVDKAQRQAPTETKELFGTEESETPEGLTLAALPDSNAGELSAQAVLPGASGFIFYVEYVPGFNGANFYSLYRHDQQTGAVTVVYSGDRQIQSVAGSADGIFVVVSMRETTNVNSDYDIFLFNVSDVANPAIFLLSYDNVNNTNVSMTTDATRIVNEQPVAGRASVVLRTKQPFALYDSVTLMNTLPQRQPSLSSNGQYISLVRDLADGSDRVLRYTVATASYLAVATSTAVLEYPSLSQNGDKVLWLQNGTTDVAKLKDITAGTTQTVLSSSSIGHPSLAGNGLFMAYVNGSNIVTKQLVTGQVQTITGSQFSFNFYAPMWSTLREFSVTIPADPNLTGDIRRVCFFLFCPVYGTSQVAYCDAVSPCYIFVGYINNSSKPETHRGFISFDLGSILPNAQITGASLNLGLLQQLNNPFSEDNLGSMALERVNYGSTLAGWSDYNTAPRLCGAFICSVDFFSPPDPIDSPIDIDVSSIVQADWLERDTLENRSQYRLRFANSHPASGSKDTGLYYDPKPTLTVKYLAP